MNSISKNLCSIKWNLLMQNQAHNSSKEINNEILNLKLVILLEYQNIKTCLQKAMIQIALDICYKWS